MIQLIQRQLLKSKPVLTIWIFAKVEKMTGEAIIFPSKSLRAERQSGITKAVDLATGFLIAFNTWAS